MTRRKFWKQARAAPEGSALRRAGELLEDYGDEARVKLREQGYDLEVDRWLYKVRVPMGMQQKLPLRKREEQPRGDVGE